MIDSKSGYIQIDGWFFEVKMVRAIKSETYGESYDAIANFTIHTNKAHIEGLMTRHDGDFSREDHRTFEKFFKQIGVEEVSFERFNGEGFKTFTKKNTQDEAVDDADKAPLKLVK